MAIKILDIGQCGFDGPRMAALWHEQLGATVDRVDDGQAAAEKLKHNSYDVVLVNRVLAADGSSGLDVIEELVKAKTHVPIMLVSDLPEAQVAAVELGAVKGFGKAALGEPATLKLVASVAAGKTREKN
jgi:DNA-binding response OmpR family regulator